jgi:hypothetical protein
MRVWFRGEQWPEYAGQELKLLEVAVEVDHARVLRVMCALPYRTRFDVEGRPDQEELQRAKVRVGRILGPRLRTTDEQIADLQADASHFWEPTESEWSQAADLLGVRVNDLRNARYRPPPS